LIISAEILPPEIVLKPENTTVVEGAMVALLCTVSHDETVTWFKGYRFYKFQMLSNEKIYLKIRYSYFKNDGYKL